MNYVWEAVLASEKNNRDRDELYFVEAANPSPYIEVSLTDLNSECPVENRIEVNPLYRFGTVFGHLFDKNIKDMIQTRELFFDVCLHYIAQLDLREGLSKEDYYFDLIAEDIANGMYGKKVRKEFSLFGLTEQRVILRSYLQLLKTANYLAEFKKALKSLYPRALIYENSEASYEMLVYLGVKETEAEKEKAVLLRKMFLPIQETVYFFYENHFGIIDIDETMIVDEMLIF